MTILDTIGPVLDFMVLNAAHKVNEAMEEGKEKLETYAKLNAPWGDRTGAARDGLNASVYFENGEVVLELAHAVSYGLWLEIKNDGEYAIIMPTLEALGPEIIQKAGGKVMDTSRGF